MHTSQEWEDQRSEITRLYLTENRPLKDIVEIMEREFSFCATCVAAQLKGYAAQCLSNNGCSERQYKTRISQWALEKNVKFDEMKAIVRKYQERKVQEGKDTLFRVRKRPVDPKKISRFIKKHKFPDEWYSKRTLSKSRKSIYMP